MKWKIPEVSLNELAKKIEGEPAFAWWVPFTIKKGSRILAKVKTKYWDKTHKYGYKLPKDAIEAKRIDEENGNTLWQDSIEKEMKINDKGEYVTDEIPDGFFDQPQKDTIEILRELKNKNNS